MMALMPKRLFLSFFLSLFVSTSLLRLFSRAHYWVNKYILKMRVSSKELFSTLKNSQLSVALQKHMGFLGSTGLNNMWIEWRNKFTAALDEVAPKVSTTVRSRKNRCPWMTPCLLNLIHKQKFLHRKIIRSNKQNQEATKRHRQIRSLTSNMYRNRKN